MIAALATLAFGAATGGVFALATTPYLRAILSAYRATEPQGGASETIAVSIQYALDDVLSVPSFGAPQPELVRGYLMGLRLALAIARDSE